MGKSTPVGSSPDSELGIKVQPRKSDPHPVGGPYPYPPYPLPSRKWFPWVVPTIVTVNIVVFIIVMYVNNCPANSESDNKCIGESTFGRFSFQNTHENPLLGPSAVTLLKIGALEVQKVVEEHQVWRLVSCMWLHAGAFHVLANMLSLLFVGIRLEQEFGFGTHFESLLSLILIIVINMAVGILPHVDNFAHLGGFVTGFLLGFVLLIRPQFGWVSKRLSPAPFSTSSKSKYKPYQYVLLLASLLTLALGLTVGFVLLLRGVDGNDHCSWCHYMSCVPTPLWTCEARCTVRDFLTHLHIYIHRIVFNFYVLTNDIELKS
ncbi:rhomboid family protein [Striga asiatica]|uniref:RHOMBOID-like protein n=1 Tax=Striga asiatica TaxID=4170 RepID=A0A5A7REY0_STRAF|nr:rhomboid family protein [Striga asiatica]